MPRHATHSPHTTTTTIKLVICHILLFYYSTISTLYFFLFLSLLCSTSHPAQQTTPHNTAQHDTTENIWSFFASDLIHTLTQASRQTDTRQLDSHKRTHKTQIQTHRICNVYTSVSSNLNHTMYTVHYRNR